MKNTKRHRTVKQAVSYQEWDTKSWSPYFPDIYRLLFKEEGMPHRGKHDPVLTF